MVLYWLFDIDVLAHLIPICSLPNALHSVGGEREVTPAHIYSIVYKHILAPDHILCLSNPRGRALS